MDDRIRFAREKKVKAWTLELRDCGIVFLISVVAAALLHFTEDSPHRTLSFDARQYLFDAERIATFILQLFKGKIDTGLLTSSDFVTSILADGPVFPGFHGAIFAALGHAPQIYDWRTIQIIQSVLHGCSAAMIYLLSSRLTQRRLLAVLAGICWGLYPAAIFWSGIFYTETTVIFFALLFACFFSASKRPLNDCSTGLAGGFVFLLKPVLVPAVALALLTRLKDWKHFAIIVCFLIVPIIPWAVYTKMVTGNASFTAQRFPAFNLAMGADTEVGACMVSPPSVLTSMFARESDPFAFPLAQWTYHFGDCVKLAVEKISILFANQSNDFRESYFGILPIYQNVLHWAIVCFGFAGFFALIFGRSEINNCSDSGKRVLCICSAVLLSHFTYILFTPAARYGFTSIPFLLVVGAYFVAKTIACYSELQGSPKIWLHARDFGLGAKGNLAYFTAAAGLLVAMVFIANNSGPGTSEEMRYLLNADDSAFKTINLVNSKKPASECYTFLIVDADNGIESAVVELNGKRLKDQFKHIRYFNSEIYRQSSELISLAYPLGMRLDDFRNWRSVKIDPAALNWNGANQVRIIAKAPCTVYADRVADERKILAPDTYCINSIGNSCDKTDPRIVSPILTAGIEQRSQLEVLGRQNSLSSSLRIKLAIGLKNEPVASCRLSSYTAQISPKNFDLYMQDVDGIKTNRRVIKAVQRTGAYFPLPAMPGATHLRVVLRGELKSETRTNGSAGLVVALLPGAAAASVNLAASGDAIPATTDWKPFEIADTIPVTLLGAKKKSLYVALYPGSWLYVCGYGADRSSPSVKLRNLWFKVTAIRDVDLAGCRMMYY